MRVLKSEGTRNFLLNLKWSIAGVGIALIVDFIFYILTGRLLGPENFGFFGVFMAIYYLTVGPLYHAIEMIAKKISAKDEEALSVLILPTLKTGFVAWLLFLLSTPILFSVFSLPFKAIIAFSLVFPLAYSCAVLAGVVQGREKFRTYAYYEILSSGAKFSALVLVVSGFGLLGAVSAPVLEIVVGTIVIAVVMRPNFSIKEFKDHLLLRRSILFVLAVYAAFSIDILFLKAFMDAKTVGLYNAVATIGKAVFFGSVAINRAVFPKFVKDPKKSFYLFHLALLLIMVGGLSMILILKLWGVEIITLTFGSAYTAAADFAPFYMVFITAVSGVSLLGNYYLSGNSSWIKSILLLPLVQTIGILAFHQSINQILIVSTVAALTTFSILYLPAFKTNFLPKDSGHTTQ